MRLQPQIIRPKNTYIVRAGMAGGAVIAAMSIGAIAMARSLPQEEPPHAALPPPGVAAAAAPPVKMAAVDGEDFVFVFSVGGAQWMRIADVDGEQALPAHGAPRLIESEDRAAAIAALGERAPDGVRAWQGRTVLVDGECAATAGELAIVAQLTGDPAYAGEGGERWTADSVFASGHKVYAARLDRCTGTWARLAERPPAFLPLPVDAPAALAAARRDLLASQPARDLQKDWRDAGMTGSWRNEATIEAQAVRHPQTGATWIFVHARLDGSCGDPAASFGALYRIDGGDVARITLATDLPLVSLDQLIDVDRDGRFELLGSSGLGMDRALMRADGTILDMLDVPFYGCPC
jgi:hypothetical protein